MDSGVVVVPWEHWVCTQCLQDNPYAVWLIKLKCFNPTHCSHHFPNEKTLVSIEPSSMMLVKMRPLPRCAFSIRGSFCSCRKYPRCQRGDSCTFAHSDVERDTWNFIKQLFQDRDLMEVLLNAKLVPQSLSNVCKLCYDGASANFNTLWLSWLQCAQPKDCEHEYRIAVAVADDQTVVKVRDIPSRLLKLSPSKLVLCRNFSKPDVCPYEEKCTYPHSLEEFEYWKWNIIHELLGKVSRYQDLRDRYNYTPDETSVSPAGLENNLSPTNYKRKFHKLVYLDELAHCQKMITLCNGEMTVELCSVSDYNGKMKQMLRFSGMDGAAMDYAIHGHAVAHVSLHESNTRSMIHCVVARREGDSLLVHLPYGRPPLSSRRRYSLYVHFEINHKYFERLHNAIDSLSSDTIRKLLPQKSLLQRGHPVCNLSREQQAAIKPFTLDDEYQMNALRKMISYNPQLPFLVMGPFGTGKTHVLAAAISALLCNPQNHILVCTHQNQCADSIYRSLQTHSMMHSKAAMRLVPNEDAARHIQGGCVRLMRNVTASELTQKRVIVTTFLTALNLKQFETNNQALAFSHILIDEGAQSREPEALGALAVANKETKIVIVGDNKQVGPKVVVLSELARKYELGYSLLERLFTYYKTNHKRSIAMHTASLLTNYRCHTSILTLPSSLFYEHTLLSRSASETHPLAPFPLIFTCSSIQKQSLKNLPAQNEYEAEVLVKKLLIFIEKWPRLKRGLKPVVGLLASTRKQVQVIRKWLRQLCPDLRKLPCEVVVKPTYLIQGEEFSAVFLSTVEPTDEDGCPHDPVRSISDELVFNTIMTRARSLIYCVGNPFILCELGEQYEVNCWSAYLQRCVQCETLQYALPKSNKLDKIKAAQEIKDKVFPPSIINQATEVSLSSDADNIIQQYIRTLKGRKEYRIGCKLVRNPQGKVDWVRDEEDILDDNVVLCRLDFKSCYQATAVPLDPSEPARVIKGKVNLKGALPGDVIKVDTIRKCVLFDESTEEAIRKTHFGSTFLCRVSEYNCIQFFPLDHCYPKFVNLPTISREEKKGVVCFDPSSINSTPRVSNFIPHEVALKMFFVVKFLGWKRRFGYPLGIIIGALPSNSTHVQQLLLKLRYNIPLSIVEVPHSAMKCESSRIERNLESFTHAITIDPEGSTDHDDALTCTVTQKGNRRTYSVGVHITNVNTFLQKGSPMDVQAAERGCTVYDAPDSITSPMLPNSIIDQASITAGKKVDSFTVLTRFDVTNEGTQNESIAILEASIMESFVISNTELTYAEAQALLVEGENNYPRSLVPKVRSYNSLHPALCLREMIQSLWKFAGFLRKKRLGEAALAYTVREESELLYLEAHYLVEEFMIWANMKVAEKLSKDFRNNTILRSQAPPNKKDLLEFQNNYKYTLPLSAAFRHLSSSSSNAAVIALAMLKSEHCALRQQLKDRKIRDVMHCVQIEHIHPQLAALHSVMWSMQSPAQYCVLQPDHKQNDGSHSSLRCQQYTQFTSPLRRYIDVVIQRQLHAALHGKRNVYTVEELKTVCMTTQKKQKYAQKYERETLSLKLVEVLKQNNKEYRCIITQMNPKEGTFSLCFTDTELRVFNQRDKNISIQHLQKNHFTGCARKKGDSESVINYTWKAKLCSLNGTPASFLSPSEVEVSASDEGNGQLSFYSPDASNCLTKKTVNLRIKSKTKNISAQTWRELQQCTMAGEASVTANSEALLRKISPSDNAVNPIPHTSWLSTLCIYTLSRSIKSSDVLNVQLCATQGKLMLEPTIQLLEVGPGLKVCVHHNKDPTKCFVGKLSRDASKEKYASLTDYVNSWEPVVLAEAAYNSVRESEFLFIRDVQLEWPPLELTTNSAGYSYYRMSQSHSEEKSGLVLKLSSEFKRSSYQFFNMSKGDLACIRYSSSEDNVKYVFHMVISHVDEEKKSSEVYMRFVMENTNCISQQVYTAIRDASGSYEIQLIPLSLPYRRIYQSLKRIPASSNLAKDIALGCAPVAYSCGSNMKEVLPPKEVSIATSYWPIEHKRRQELNRYQKSAIDLAWSSNFVMIQGPPGTGKSVTGAHIAYALAMKLRKEKSESVAENNCVMYCGPSQQSVNVVLDIFDKLLKSPGTDAPVKLKIIRVFSKTIEKKDFSGPEMNTEVFNHQRSSALCEKEHEKYSLHHIVRRNNPGIAEMETEFKRLNSEGKLASYADSCEYKKMVSLEEEKVLKNDVDIVLCTCNEATSHRITSTLIPKYCIVDECAMATEPECMVPVRRAEHVVLIGDHQQLQPVIQFKGAEQMGLGKSLFERYAGDKQVQPHLLEIQYRMHPAICEFPSKAFYKGTLKTAESVMKRHSVMILRDFWPRGEGHPMVFCHVEGEEKNGRIALKGSPRVGAESKFNPAEAEKIVAIVEVLTCRHSVPNEQIAILTPYSAQKEEIKERLKQRREQQKRQRRQQQKQSQLQRILGDVLVKTITESQGSEYGIVLLSTVRSRQVYPDSSENADISWIRKNLGFVSDAHRTCVGITRCKFGLVIVGNAGLLSYDHIWNKLIRHYKEKKCFVNGDKFPH